MGDYGLNRKQENMFVLFPQRISNLTQPLHSAMNFRFKTIAGVSSPETHHDTVHHMHVYNFEMSIIPRPIFASLSIKSPSSNRQPGMPLFTLARAAPMTDSRLRVVRIKGDGRCMFRALSQGLARNQGRVLGPAAEEQEADQLRLAVAEALCRSPKRRSEFGDAVISLQAEDTLKNYCKRIMSTTFWGGEPELLTLSKMLRVPIYVYLSNAEAGRGGIGFIPIQKYGEKYAKATKEYPKRRPVRLLYTSGNHYDLLVK